MIKQLALFIFLGVIFFVLSVPFYSGDVKNHLAWGNSLVTLGTMNFYGRDFPGFAFPNYPPVTMLLFMFFTKLYILTNQLVWLLNTQIGLFPSKLVFYFQSENVDIAYLKLPALLAHLGLGWFIFKYFNKKMGLIYLFNPALLYLTLIWGQVDILPVCFFVIALYLAFKKNWFWSTFSITLALLSKQTIIIFYPLFLYIIFLKFGIKKVVCSILGSLVIFYLSYLPFHSFDLIWPLALYKLNFQLVANSVNENAINVWGLLFNFKRVDDNQLLLGVSYQVWGYICTLLALLPTTIIFLKKQLSLNRAIIFSTLLSLGSFLFLTRMHERYLAPVVVLATLLVAANKKFWPGLLLVTIVYLVNLYRGLYQPYLPFYQLFNNLIFLDLLVFGLLAGFIFYSFKLFKEYE